MQDLGYCNGWYGGSDAETERRTPEVVKKCRDLKHKTKDVNNDPSNHGYDTITICEECDYRYHTDSSD